MDQVIRIGLDIPKHVFHAQGAEERAEKRSASGLVGVGV